MAWSGGSRKEGRQGQNKKENNTIYLRSAKNGKWKRGAEMRSCVPRSFPIVHSIDAIHHLAETLWLFCAYKEPIHQLHHP